MSGLEVKNCQKETKSRFTLASLGTVRLSTVVVTLARLRVNTLKQDKLLQIYFHFPQHCFANLIRPASELR